MSTSAFERARLIAEKLKALPPDEIDRISQANVDSTLEEHEECCRRPKIDHLNG